MSSPFRSRFRALFAAAAVTVAIPLAGCNQPSAHQAEAGLPDLPATLPLVLGEPTAPVYAPAASDLPSSAPIGLRRIAQPTDSYAYADDAWSFADTLGYAPPDYGFYYDEVEPWAWQGYDDSLFFVEPLDYGYRSYYYRPGDEYPYFIRDPYWGYGYDDGALVVVYDRFGGILPYHDYGPRFDYASRYYYRGHDLYWASRHRHPVIASNWLDRRDFFRNYQSEWSSDRFRQPEWRAFSGRFADRRERYWNEERARRRADSVRFAAWQEQDFRTPAPPRAIPARWARADWARDARRFSLPSRGYRGDPAEQARAAGRERLRFAQQAQQLSQHDKIRTNRERIRREGEEVAFVDRRSRRSDDIARFARKTEQGTADLPRVDRESRRRVQSERYARADERIQHRAETRAARAFVDRADPGKSERTRNPERRSPRRATEVSRNAERRAERRVERPAPTLRRGAELDGRQARAGVRASPEERRFDRAGVERNRARNEARERSRRESPSVPRAAARNDRVRSNGFESRRAERAQVQSRARQEAQVDRRSEARRERQVQRSSGLESRRPDRERVSGRRSEARQVHQAQRSVDQARSEQRQQQQAARADRAERHPQAQARLARADNAGSHERRQRRERGGQ